MTYTLSAGAPPASPGVRGVSAQSLSTVRRCAVSHAVLLLGFAPSPLQMRTSFHSSSNSRCSEMRAGLGAAPADGGNCGCDCVGCGGCVSSAGGSEDGWLLPP